MKKTFTPEQYTIFLIENLKNTNSLHSVSRLSPFAWLQETNIHYKLALIEFIKKNNTVERITVYKDKLDIDDIFTSEIFTKKESLAMIDIEAIKSYINKIFENEKSKKIFNKITGEIGYIILDSLLIFSLIHSKNGLLVNNKEYSNSAEQILSENFEVLIYDNIAYKINKLGKRKQSKFSVEEIDRDKYFKAWKKTYNRFGGLRVSIIDHIETIKRKYEINGDLNKDYSGLRNLINEELNVIEILEQREEYEKSKQTALLFLEDKENTANIKPDIQKEIIQEIKNDSSVITKDFLKYIINVNNDINTIVDYYQNHIKKG